jgi:DNA invertase Pin-like site-specific DNA recombinase
MGKIVAYLRASTDKQDLNHQKLEILEFARKKEIRIDEFVEITISSRKTSKQRRIALVLRNIHVITIKQNLDIANQDMNAKIIITLFSLFGELERDLISLRTKEALAAKKASGQQLGKPKGTLQKSKFDNSLDRIKELLGYGLSVRKIAKVLGYSSHIALNTYINKRGLQQSIKS